MADLSFDQKAIQMAASKLRSQERTGDALVLESIAELLGPEAAVHIPDQWVGDVESVDFVLWNLLKEFQGETELPPSVH